MSCLIHQPKEQVVNKIEEITKSRKYARKTQKSSNRSFFSFQSIKGFFAPWEILILLEAQIQNESMVWTMQAK